MKVEIIHSKYVRDLVTRVLSDNDPNMLLRSIDPIDRDLFYVVKFVTIIWNGGIDAYLDGYCGDDLLNAHKACENLNLKYLAEKFDEFLSIIPELKSIQLNLIRFNHVEAYQRLLENKNIESFRELYEFEIEERVHVDLEHSLKTILSAKPQKLKQIMIA